MTGTGDLFREVSTRKLAQLAGRIDVCLDRLNDDQIWARGSENENAVGNLVLHLIGNTGQWILSGVGGAPDVRARNDEFNERSGASKEELKARLAERIAAVNLVISGVSDARLTHRIQVQRYDVSVLEAIYHVVEHFAQHMGQIVFATKLFTGQELGFYTHLKRPTHGEKTP